MCEKAEIKNTYKYCKKVLRNKLKIWLALKKNIKLKFLLKLIIQNILSFQQVN